MASQCSHVSPDSSHDVYQIPGPVYVQSSPLQAPLSPPPTVKKIAPLFSASLSSQEPGFQVRSPQCSNNQLMAFHLARRVRPRLFCILAALLGLFCWWRSGSVQDFGGLRKKANDLLLPSVLDGSHFIPASNKQLHVNIWELCRRSALIMSVCRQVEIHPESTAKRQ